MNLVFAAEAEAELAEAARFYAGQAGLAVAHALIDEFERTARLLVGHSGLGTPTLRGRRLMPLHRFPYSIVYRTEADSVRIVAFAHHSRRPGYWRGRP